MVTHLPEESDPACRIPTLGLEASTGATLTAHATRWISEFRALSLAIQKQTSFLPLIFYHFFTILI